jgi:type 1 fimbriae regulatory protein FimB/type 1 fimbriae regulatory protein FimE
MLRDYFCGFWSGHQGGIRRKLRGRRDRLQHHSAKARLAELVDLRWPRSTCKPHPWPSAKEGTPATHPIRGDELRALRRLQREQDPKSPFVFTSDRGAPFTTAGFARMIERAGEAAGFKFKAHPHMLRHACGFALANKSHDTRSLQAYLGHKNIQHTVASIALHCSPR